MPSRESRSADPERGRTAPGETSHDASRGPAARPPPERVPQGSERAREVAARAVSGLRSAGGRIVGAGLLGVAVLVLGLVASVLLIAAETQPVVTIDVLTGGSCELLADESLRDQCSQSGASRHSYALLILGLLVAVMSWGASLGASRPAAAAVALAGVVALAVVLIGDLPDVDETGEIGLRFAEAEAQAGSGFYISLAGGAVAVVAGVLGVLRPRR